MFGRHYFGGAYYGPRYFGDGGVGAPEPPALAGGGSGGGGGNTVRRQSHVTYYEPLRPWTPEPRRALTFAPEPITARLTLRGTPTLTGAVPPARLTQRTVIELEYLPPTPVQLPPRIRRLAPSAVAAQLTLSADDPELVPAWVAHIERRDATITAQSTDLAAREAEVADLEERIDSMSKDNARLIKRLDEAHDEIMDLEDMLLLGKK